MNFLDHAMKWLPLLGMIAAAIGGWLTAPGAMGVS